VKKFGDDDAGNWAALMAYYGFLSMFPLLLAFTTILGFVVHGNADLQQRLLDSALANFPVIGTQIENNLGALQGSVLALVVGIVGAVWAGMGVVLTAETAMNEIWDVPRRARPNFWKSRVRALIAMIAFGVVVTISAGLASLGGAGGSFGWALRAVALVGTVVLNVAIFGAAYRYLTVADVRWRQVLPGAALAAIGWMLLLALGSWFVTRQLKGASETYGTLAFVIALLAWIALSAELFLVGGELNVVLARRLWPRSLNPPPLTEPDRRVLAAEAKQEAARSSEEVRVDFHPPDAPGPEPADAPPRPRR